MTDHGLFHWNELMTHDAAKAKKFYTDTVGWTFEDMEMPKGTYSMMKVGDKFAGGIFEMKEPELKDVPEKWVPYLSVDDVDALVSVLKSAGNTVSPIAFGDANHGKALWEVVGLAADPGGVISIYAHAIANATGAGSMPFRIEYFAR